MFKQKIFIASLIVLVLLATMHFVGIRFELYFHFEKYDIPMHILGGLWIALTVFWLLPVLTKNCSIKNYKIKSFWVGLLAVIVLASVWEIMELWGGITSTSDKVYLEDTMGDYVCAFVGLLIGFVYFLNQRKCVNGVCELVKPTSLNSLNNFNIR